LGNYFKQFANISTLQLTDLKINKYFLSLFYNSIILNDNNLKSIRIEHITLLHQFLIFQINEETLNENQKADAEEINHWKFILIRYLIKAKDKFYENSNLLTYYLNCFHNSQSISIQECELTPKLKFEQICIFELIRDFLEFKKDNSEIEMAIENIKILLEYFVSNVNNLVAIVKYFVQNNYKDYSNYEMNGNNQISLNFKLFLCLVDLFSTLLPIQEYREICFNTIKFEGLFDNIYFLLSECDKFYENTFKRNKIKENFQGVVESNVFYCFQTNIFKFLANFFFANKKAKEYYLDPQNSLRFYYLLNHMKIDKSNPFKKEWTVLLVKALCEDCYQIQKKIMDLKADDIDPFLKEYLMKNNYDFKFDRENYKLNINKKDNN
jgi:hypothetical protein